MGRRIVAAVAGAAVTVAGTAAVVATASGDDGSGAAEAADGTAVETATAAVENRDLVTTDTYEGQLGTVRAELAAAAPRKR